MMNPLVVSPFALGSLRQGIALALQPGCNEHRWTSGRPPSRDNLAGVTVAPELGSVGQGADKFRGASRPLGGGQMPGPREDLGDG